MYALQFPTYNKFDNLILFEYRLLFVRKKDVEIIIMQAEIIVQAEVVEQDLD